MCIYYEFLHGTTHVQCSTKFVVHINCYHIKNNQTIMMVQKVHKHHLSLTFRNTYSGLNHGIDLVAVLTCYSLIP